MNSNIFPYKSKEELTIKEFYILNSKEKEKYIRTIVEIPEQERSGCQKYILNFFSYLVQIQKEKPKNFISMD